MLNSYEIIVRESGGNVKAPTQPDLAKPTATKVSPEKKAAIARNFAVLSAGISAAKTISKSYINIQYAEHNNSVSAANFNLALRGAKWAVGIAVAGPVLGGIIVGVDLLGDAMNYNSMNRKADRVSEYTRAKFRTGTVQNSRFSGGRF